MKGLAPVDKLTKKKMFKLLYKFEFRIKFIFMLECKTKNNIILFYLNTVE